MKKNDHYFIDVGYDDYERLFILNELYNPKAIQFMHQSGLQPGMHILEFGCGIGEFACELARAVGAHGKVTAIDQNPEQIALSKETAKKQNVHNIEFITLNVEELDQLKQNFDMAFGRWTLIFTPQPEIGLQKLYQSLKNGGTLVLEEADIINHGLFSYPHTPEINEWQNIMLKNFNAQNLCIDFGTSLYKRFIEMNFNQIQLTTSQPLITNARDKSVLRLASLATRNATITHELFSEDEFNNYIKRLELFERQNSLVGFLRNILISGKKIN